MPLFKNVSLPRTTAVSRIFSFPAGLSLPRQNGVCALCSPLHCPYRCHLDLLPSSSAFHTSRCAQPLPEYLATRWKEWWQWRLPGRRVAILLAGSHNRLVWICAGRQYYVHLDGESFAAATGTFRPMASSEPRAELVLLQVVNQTSFEYTATRSTFVFDAGPVTLNVTFLSPVSPTDKLRQSFPITYVEVNVQSSDGSKHDVQIYTDVSAGRC
jgi:hypothetical protein